MAGKVNLQTKEAVQEIKTLIKELKNLDKTLGTMSKGNVAAFNKMNNSMSGFSSKIKELNSSIERLSGITKTNSKRLTKNSNELKRNSNLTKTASKNSRAQTRAVLDNTKALRGETTQTERNTSAKKKSTISTKALKDALVAVAAGFTTAIVLSYKFGKQLFNQIKEMDSVRYAITQITESAWEYRVSIGFLISLTRDFGVELTSTSERWVKFLAAAKQSGLSLSDTENIFRSMTKTAAVLGLKTDELKGVYLALEQMLSKGKITTEELRRQLGERLPGAMGIMAASMGVSLEALDKMMKKGEVLSSKVLPGFADAVEIAFGIQSLEKVETLQAAVGRLEGAWDQFIFNMAESEGPFSTAIKNMLENLTELMNAITFITGDPDQKLRIDVVAFDNEAKEKINKEARDILDERKGLNNELERLDRELQEANANFQAAIRQEDKDAAQLVLDEKTKALVDYGKEVKEIEKEIADSNLNSLQATVDKQKKIWEDGLKEIEELRQKELNESSGFTGWIKNNAVSQFLKQSFGYEGDITEEKKMQNDENQISYAWSLAQLDNYKKLLQVSKEHTKEEEDNTKRYRRKVRLAKEWAETNRLLINSLEEVIRQNEKFNEEEEGGLVERSERLKYNANARKMIADLELEDALKANEVWLENQKITLDGYLEAHKNNAEDLAKQEEQNKKQLEAYEEEHEEKKRLIHQAYRHKRKKDIELEDKENRELIEDRFALVSEHLTTEKAEALKHYQDKLEAIRKGGNEEKKLLFAIQKIEVDYHNLMVDNRIEQVQWELDHVKTLGEKAEKLKEIRRLEASKKADPADDYGNKNSADGMGSSIIDPLFAQDFATWSNKSQEFINEMFGLADAIYEHRIQKIEQEISAEEAKYDRLLELAKNDEEETKIIERNKALAIEKLEKKKRKEQVKQAKLQKALNISQAIQSTAVAVVNALATSGNPWIGIAMAALVGAAGAVQIASIASTPIPQFADGGVMDHDGKALINDGGKQEYVERGGKVLTTGTTNAIVDLKKGDVIHKDFETLQRKSLLLSLTSGGGNITEKELNLAFGIKEEIKSGFKKAKIESNVVVINKSDDYRNKMSLWD